MMSKAEPKDVERQKQGQRLENYRNFLHQMKFYINTNNKSYYVLILRLRHVLMITEDENVN